MKLKNFGRVFLPKAISTAMLLLLCGLTALIVTGCDEGMNMMGPVVMGPGEEPAETPSEDKKPSSNGEVKQPDEGADPGSEQPKPTPEPEKPEIPESKPTSTIAITIAGQARDGSVLLSGMSTNIPEGTTVTIMLGGVVMTTATVTADGSWGATVPTSQAEILTTIGTVTVTAVAMKATASSSFEYTTPMPPLTPEPEWQLTEEIVPALKTLVPAVTKEHQPPESNPGDFVGQIRTLFSSIYGNSTQPLAGVLVTVTKGSRAGEQVTTNQGGYYLFPNVTEDDLYLRVEKEHFEPKEVIVHRARPTVLQKQTGPILDRNDPWNTPGTVVVGQRWPNAIRFIFEETLLPNDILFVRDDGYRPLGRAVGQYHWSGAISGIVTVLAGEIDLDRRRIGTFAHELGHAHQHAVALVNNIAIWDDSSEGKAYAEARTKDWKEVGKSFLDQGLANSYHERAHLREGAAEISRLYWGRNSWAKGSQKEIKTTMPNRWRWAEEWLSKQ